MKAPLQLTRRDMLRLGLAAGASLALFPTVPAAAALAAGSEQRRFKIGACDWSIGKATDIDAFRLAREIGLDGLQISVGSAANNLRLREPKVQEQYLAAEKETGVKIASLALAELNRVPYKSDPRTVQWVEDAIKVCSVLGTKVLLLAFFSENDLTGDPAGVTEVVRRLTGVAPQAERAGVILGIESWLSAKEHMEILDRVESNAVQVYYDVRNSTDRGYDIYEEIRQLGAKRICEFHAKENGALLGKGKVDFKKVRQAMDDIGYRGWIQIEGAVPKGGDVLESYKENCRFLRDIFATD
jgi:L-ribulose-5-phosphate 3-epimerase